MYKGEFEDINGNSYTLTVDDGDPSVYELKFGGSPFATQMDNGDSTIYKPIKCQSGTIGLIAKGDDYQFALYTGNAQGHKVTLKDSLNNVLWIGYITPSLYNIGYAKFVEELSVDCIDGLSTLQYYKYTPFDGVKPDTQKLQDIVLHCIRQCGCYSTIVLMAGTKIVHSGTAIGALWTGSVSESDFIDDEAAEDDNDNTKTYLEVLESICKFMCVTCVAQGDTVYLIDYDSVKLANCDGISIDVSTGTASSVTVTPNEYTITGASYADSGTTLSLDNVYNKVTVSTDPKEYDELLVDFFKDAENVTHKSTRTGGSYGVNYTEFVTNAYGNENLQTFVDEVYGADNNVNSYNLVAIQYFKSPYYACHAYDNSNGWQDFSALTQTPKYSFTQDYCGGWLAKCFVQKLPGAVHYTDIDQAFEDAELSYLQLDEYIFLTNPQANHMSTAVSVANNMPFISTTVELSRSVNFGGQNAYLLVSGSVMFHRNFHYSDAQPNYYGSPMYPVPDGEVDLPNGSHVMDKSTGYLTCRLIWGDYAWNGTAWVSALTAPTFTIPYLHENIRCDQAMYRDISIVNTVSWRLGTNEKGYLIPMPTSPEVLSGAPTLEIFAPRTPDAADPSKPVYEIDFMALKNFKIIPIVADPTYSGDLDTDTVYTNVIDVNNAMELDDITLDVITHDGKNPCSSEVSYVNGLSQYWLQDTFNAATSTGETGIERFNGTISNGNLRQEEHIVYRITNQYSNPSKVLELTLNADLPLHGRVVESNLGATMIVESKGVDYRYQEYSYKLIEKKRKS